MHSTSSPQTDAEPGSPGGLRAGAERGRQRGKKSGKKIRKAATRDAMVDGLPSLESLRPVLNFLAFPAIIVIGITLTGGHWPKIILYPIALALGLYVALSVFRGTELVLAVLLFYLPFSPVYVIPLAPGINGTNALLGLALLATIFQAQNSGRSWIHWLPGTAIMLSFAFFSTLSAVTILFQPGGYEWLMFRNFDALKGWIDQFLVYVVALSAIRDHDTAKRVFFYMCLGSVMIVLYTLPEMFDKMSRSSIEKSRVAGPLNQSNDFAGLLAYTITFLVAVFLAFIHSIRAWLLTPYFIIALKLLISTFSRGAYLAMVAGGIMAAYLKGKGFLIFTATLLICSLLIFPSLVPQSVMARLQSSVSDAESTSAPKKLDKSSEHRLILWKAAGDMILESPIQGKGFKAFSKLKSQYTERPVHESDPHNFYLYVAAQMGLPVLVMFLFLLMFTFHSGRVLSRNKVDRTVKAIGIAGAAATACFAAVCMFGSRVVSPEYSGYYFVLIVCLQVLRSEDCAKPFLLQNKGKRLSRSSNRANASAVTGIDQETVEEPLIALSKTTRRGMKSKSGAKGRRRELSGAWAVAVQRAANDAAIDSEQPLSPSTELVEIEEEDGLWSQPGRRTSRKSGRKRTNAFEHRNEMRRREL